MLILPIIYDIPKTFQCFRLLLLLLFGPKIFVKVSNKLILSRDMFWIIFINTINKLVKYLRYV